MSLLKPVFLVCGICSVNELGVFDEIETVSSLDNSLNVRVELGEEFRVFFELLSGIVVFVKVFSFNWEEVGSKTVMGV